MTSVLANHQGRAVFAFELSLEDLLNMQASNDFVLDKGKFGKKDGKGKGKDGKGKKGKGKPGLGGPQIIPGDWVCPGCGIFLIFPVDWAVYPGISIFPAACRQ